MHDSPLPELALDAQPSAVLPETTNPNPAAPAGPVLEVAQGPSPEVLTAPAQGPPPEVPTGPAQAPPAPAQRTTSAVAQVPLPPPPPEPVKYTGPEIHQRLSALFLVVLQRVGLDKLLNTMAVYVKTCEPELFVEGEIKLETFYRPLDQNHIPRELIGRVLGQIALYIRRFIQAPFALPTPIQDDAVQAIAAIPDPDGLILELYTQVETRLAAQTIEAKRQAEKQAEAAQEARATRKLAEVAPRKREPLFSGRLNRNRLLRGALATLLFFATAGYWINFALSQLRKEPLDPRTHLNYLDPDTFSSIVPVQKARVTMGTLFILVPPGKLPGMSQEERQSVARRLLEILQRPDVKNVNLRDDTIQIHIPVRP